MDTLRRSKHLDVTIAKVFSPEESHSMSDLKNQLECRLMYGVRIIADTSIDECLNDTYDVIVLPGGTGASNMAKNKNLCDMLKH